MTQCKHQYKMRGIGSVATCQLCDKDISVEDLIEYQFLISEVERLENQSHAHYLSALQMTTQANVLLDKLHNLEHEISQMEVEHETDIRIAEKNAERKACEDVLGIFGIGNGSAIAHVHDDDDLAAHTAGILQEYVNDLEHSKREWIGRENTYLTEVQRLLNEVKSSDVLIEALQTQLSRYEKENKRLNHVDRLNVEMDQQLENYNLKLSRYEEKYNNLLAVLHRDGGQYRNEHGEQKATEDGITKVLTAYQDNDRYESAVEVEEHNIERHCHLGMNWLSLLVSAELWNKKVKVLVMPAEVGE